jgi:hypothetical protein
MRLATSSLRVLLAAGFLLWLAPTPAGAGGVVSSTFDSGLEGWEATGLDFDFTIFPPALTDLFLVPNPGDMVHETSGGNPDGYARLTDAITEPSSFAEAPAQYTGDLSGFIGGTFSFDHKLFDRGADDDGLAEISPYVFLIISGDLFDLNALAWGAPPATGNTDWVHFDINLESVAMGGDLMFVEDVSASTLFPDSPVTGTVGDILGRGATLSFEEIMANATTILVPFEIANNEGNQELEWGGIDNVIMASGSVPEPSAFALMLLSGALLLRRRAL